ncbi:MAG TPA: uroporphyrinogen decarboxylase family protein [Candidatus Ratteibacteria bacterium]|nr:uroporphyrinogen decarboxylase family protein [bacterium]HRS07058.1 uroporphyrinogen decarboxylase family protein [Candidatus Ratteibacteria bacterium]HRV04363.1 uroporphyrinogen decarboxylase family protein [Candidatus Ratteibacteria bacterium]
MTIRERILSIFQGQKPDCVPFILDLSHWYYHHFNLPWDLTMPYDEPDTGLLDIHRRFNAGFYVPILGIGWTAKYQSNVEYLVYKEDFKGTPSIVWEYKTRFGSIKRRRIWEQKSYSWPIYQWGIKTKDDLRILQYALTSRVFYPCFESYNHWRNAVGDIGVVYMPFGYSAMGQLLNAWMGVEKTIYASFDIEDAVKEFVESVNENNLKAVDLLCESPAEIIMMGDNFSSDIQPPSFFNKWSRQFYVEAIKRFHVAGKKIAVHIDGKLKNSIRMISETGADCGDAITPTPAGDLTPEECRLEAGDNFILSGGIAPGLWYKSIDINQFEMAVMNWLETKSKNFRIMAAAGDQVPPGADEERIKQMKNIVDDYGKF